MQEKFFALCTSPLHVETEDIYRCLVCTVNSDCVKKYANSMTTQKSFKVFTFIIPLFCFYLLEITISLDHYEKHIVLTFIYFVIILLLIQF